LFAGYERYHVAERVRQQFQWLPEAPRRLVAKALRASPPSMVAAVARAVAAPSPLRQVRRVQRLSLALEDVSPLNAFEASSATWIELRDVLSQPALVLPDAWQRARSVEASPLLTYQLIDLQTYLPDAVLAKVDRASMAASLEVRVPLLNSRVVEFALGLPDDSRVRGGRTKHLIRELLYRYVPRALVDRPKQGFSIPMNTWLRGPLRDWADDLLSESSLSQGGILNGSAVAARWREHRRGEADWSYPLWSVLVFEDWRRHWAGSPR
jgi:asparagine synthase (glutamine-hydrolysing)